MNNTFAFANNLIGPFECDVCDRLTDSLPKYKFCLPVPNGL